MALPDLHVQNVNLSSRPEKFVVFYWLNGVPVTIKLECYADIQYERNRVNVSCIPYK